MAQENRILNIIAPAAAAGAKDDPTTGQLPEPERVKEFNEFMAQYNVTPYMYFPDPAFDDPGRGDQDRINRYPDNVFVLPMTDDEFMADNPDIARDLNPVAYVAVIEMVMSPTMMMEAYDNPTSPNRLFYRETKRKRFDPFDVVIQTNDDGTTSWVAGYDPVANRYNRITYDYKGPLPKNITYLDFLKVFFNVLDNLVLLKLVLKNPKDPRLSEYFEPNLSKVVMTNDIINHVRPFIQDYLPQHAHLLKQNATSDEIAALILELRKKATNKYIMTRNYYPSNLDDDFAKNMNKYRTLRM